MEVLPLISTPVRRIHGVHDPARLPGEGDVVEEDVRSATTLPPAGGGK